MPTLNSNTFKVALPSDTSIELSRTFNAPAELLFTALTTPEHVRRWWGCLSEDYSVPVCEIDLRVGGSYRFVNATPDGEFGFHGSYREVDAPHRLVYTEIFELFPDTESLVIATLTEQDGKTHLRVFVEYPSVEVRDAVIKSGMEYGAAISYDRLEEIAMSLEAVR